MLTHVDYLCGRMHDMHRVARRVHAAPVVLRQAGPEFAVGCGYGPRAKVT